MPPSYSAKKVEGRRAYALARRDQPVELKPVPVTVSRAVLTAFDDDTASVSITCSAGFYVRSFAHELGRMLGCGACLEALRRTRSGEFTLDAAVPFEWLAAAPEARDLQLSRLQSAMVAPAALLPDIPAVELTAQGLDWVAHGRDLGPAQWRAHREPPKCGANARRRGHLGAALRRRRPSRGSGDARSGGRRFASVRRS